MGTGAVPGNLLTSTEWPECLTSRWRLYYAHPFHRPFRNQSLGGGVKDISCKPVFLGRHTMNKPLENIVTRIHMHTPQCLLPDFFQL